MLDQFFAIKEEAPVSQKTPNTQKDSPTTIEPKKVFNKAKPIIKKVKSEETKNKEKLQKELLAKKQKAMRIKVESHLATNTKPVIRELLTLNKPVIFTVVNEFTMKKHKFKITEVKK